MSLWVCLFFCQVWGVIVLVICLLSIHHLEQITFPPTMSVFSRVFFLAFFATESCFQSGLGLALAFKGGAIFFQEESAKLSIPETSK